jgi:hypothetical protein
MRRQIRIEGLPGHDLVQAGLRDVEAGRLTPAACLVEIGRTRLAAAGVLPESIGRAVDQPERELYRLLREEGGDAYSRYNSLLRELISFENAAEKRVAGLVTTP